MPRKAVQKLSCNDFSTIHELFFDSYAHVYGDKYLPLSLLPLKIEHFLKLFVDVEFV
jgi:hypothetical protein